MVVRVGDDDVVVRSDRHAGGLGELALDHAELAELAVVDHLVPLDVRARWVGRRAARLLQ